MPQWVPRADSAAEQVVIIGGGPAGLSAAIYAARAGLSPLVVAPPVGGQLQGKGVSVENYPGIFGVTGPELVKQMQRHAREYGASFLFGMATKVDLESRPFVIEAANATIRAQSIILGTGADSKWLDVDGEQAFRGGGVSSCATCDGFLFRDQHTVVIGGGDTAMEDALVLARTSSKVTVVHRRDSFRASKILAERVLQHDKIDVVWNATVQSFEGETPCGGSDAAPADEGELMEESAGCLTKVHLEDTQTGSTRTLQASGAFVAIGHAPNTWLVRSTLQVDAQGYLVTKKGSTATSVPGVFAAGDVADRVYRQAITSAASGAQAALDAERWLSSAAGVGVGVGAGAAGHVEL